MTAGASNLPSFSRVQIGEFQTRIVQFTTGARNRGRNYFQSGRVRDLSFETDCIDAVVEGGELYDVQWFWSDEYKTWLTDCSCPVGVDCKHAYAVGLATLSALSRTETASGDDPRPAGQPRPTLGDILRIDSNPWRRRETVRRFLRQPPLHLDPYDHRVMDLLDHLDRESDPELGAYLLTQSLLTITGGKLPAEMEPYRSRPDLREIYDGRARDDLAKRLLAWVSKSGRPTQRSLRFVWNLDLEARTNAWRLSVEARITTSRLDDEPRSFEQLRQLYSEAQRNPDLLPADQLQVLVAFLEASARMSFGIRFASAQVQPATAMEMMRGLPDAQSTMVWSTEITPEVAARAGIRAGGALRYSSQGLRILPSVVATDVGAKLQLMCLWPDHQQRSLSEIVYFPSDASRRISASVLHDGVFHSVAAEPPDEIRDRFLQVNSIDIPAEKAAEFLSPLAQHLPHVREAVSAHTKWLRGTVVVSFDLRDDDWMQVRIFLLDGDDSWLPHVDVPPNTTVHELEPSERWVRWSGTAPPTDGPFNAILTTEASVVESTEEQVDATVPPLHQQDIWMEVPDPTLVTPTMDWLDALGIAPGNQGAPGDSAPLAEDRHTGWWIRATQRRMATFAELWESRPRDVRFVGTERVQRLLAGVHTVKPKLTIKKSGIDWFSVSADWEAEGLSLSDADLAKLRSSTNRFVKLASGWVRRDTVDAVDQTAHLLADLGVEIGRGEQRITLWQLTGARPESLAALEEMTGSREAKKALAKLQTQLREFKGVPEVDVPSGIRAELRPYQRRGLDFLAYTSNLGIGAILADDMGLGKTLQALAWLQKWVAEKPKGGPSLVVCPTSVMHNWRREAEQFAPELRVLLLERGDERHTLRKEIRRYDLVITNYALLRRDIEEWSDVSLRALILDEAQNIKNPDAAVSRAACRLKATHRLALTGTPLENRPLDLWSIVEFVNPGYLGNRTQFSTRFDRVDAAPYARALLSAKLRPILLRRLKRDVATDLPERIEERRDCELTEGQRQLYLAELRRSRKLVDELSEDRQALNKNKITILAALTRLRQICCHPALAKGKANLGSGKFDALFELLEPLLDEGHKVLVFSQFVQCLALLEKEMAKRGIRHHKLTGESVKREAIVEGFQNDPDPCVFLISLKAGGTGLNLTAASYVVLFDPWWNPAVEAQAIDRTHRIGQDRTVIAYRMLAVGTIEEKIWELQQQKSALARDVLGEDGFARNLDRDALQYLLQEV